jgi:rare lipoprotein A
MRYAIRGFVGLASLISLASCGSVDRGNDSQALETVSLKDVQKPAPNGVSDDVIKVGTAYSVGGTTYTPFDSAMYDEVGYASIYGRELAGKATANGETFNPAGVSAAHKTLPMPSYVEVTALDTGRTIVVRINDRGPFANDRLIDLSEGAAQQLGLGPQGLAGVRVRRVNPPEQEKAVLRQGKAAAERIETPDQLLKVLRDKLAKLPRPSAVAQTIAPTAPVAGKASLPEKQPASADSRFVREGAKASAPKAVSTSPQPAALGAYVAQIGAFSSRSRAEALARKVGATVAASPNGKVFRVRFGPYPTETEAAAAARQKGYPQAPIYRD